MRTATIYLTREGSSSISPIRKKHAPNINDNNARLAGKPRVTGRFVTQYGTPPSNSMTAPRAMSHKASRFMLVDSFSLDLSATERTETFENMLLKLILSVISAVSRRRARGTNGVAKKKTHVPTRRTTAMYNALVRIPLMLGFGNWKI